MTPELYNKEILRLAANIPHEGRLQEPDVTGTKTSRICGSRVTVDMKLEDGRIADFSQDLKACALSQAACALFGKLIVGMTKEDVLAMKDAVEHMLKSEDPMPEGDWEVFSIFEPARDITSRHASILLPFEATLDAFNKCC